MKVQSSRPCSEVHRSPLRRFLQRAMPIVALLVAIMAITERDAYAYTDPGSGALMWQLALAAMVGISFYFRKAIGWIREWRKKPEDDPGANEDV